MRSVFKFLSLPKSSFRVTSIGIATRFELPRVVTIAGAICKLAVESDDVGVGDVVFVELRVSTVG